MAASASPAAVDHPGDGPRAGLWQAPVFVLGVVALVAVVVARPLLAGDAAAGLHHDLSEARRLLERGDGDPAEVARLAQHVLDAKGAHPELAGEADLLLGTAVMRQAAAADAAHADALWAAARRHLEAAENENVPEKDRDRLQYRLGVAGYYTHDDPDKVIARIKTAIEQADDPIEGYTVLTQAYLRHTPPNLQEALAANLKLRNLPQAKEDVLAPARLLGGELELRLGHFEQARRVLAKVGTEASPEVQAKALRLRAHSFQDQENWTEAADLWRQARTDGRQPGEALYNLGLCAQHQEQADEAARCWQQCVQVGGDEGQAAALALAEQRLKGPDPESALEMFAAAVERLKPGDEWANPLADKAAAAALFQEAGKTYLDNRQYEAAVKLAGAYARVAAAGEADVLRAKASAEWARARREEARVAAKPETRQTARDAARQLFLQAAAAYADAADRAPDLPTPGEYLWLSARCSWEAQDLDQAAAKLDRVLKTELSDDQKKEEWYVQRQGEAWYLLGEARRQLRDEAGARTAYLECLKYMTPFAYRARCQLALAAMDHGNLDEAQEDLELNLKLLRINPDPEAQEKSLYALGNLFYQRGNYAAVVEQLGQAIPRFPANPEATRAHYQLADSYRRLADQANVSANLADGSQSKEKREHAMQLYRRYLTNAATEFLKLAELLDSPEGQGLLTREEQVQTPFLAADCLFDLGDYADALTAYDALAGRYPGRLEGLNALGGMVRCYSAMGETTKMQQRLAEIDALLPKMPKPVRDQWSEWLTVARKPVSTP